ncbi:hypothetical protein AMTRI_Chr02g214210 [Amborella trichopoda]
MASSLSLRLVIWGLLAVASMANFYSDFDITWGNDRAKILNNGEQLHLSLDKYSGSGFQSKNEYLFGNIHMRLKLVPGNSAGTAPPMTKSTSNSWGNREQQFHLWFDPTKDFHTYSIWWNPNHIKFSVDGTPVRVLKNAEHLGVPFPKNQPMKLHSSLWNADDCATRGASSSSPCKASAWLSQEALDTNEQEKLKWVQKNYMVYSYCSDTKRFSSGTSP